MFPQLLRRLRLTDRDHPTAEHIAVGDELPVEPWKVDTFGKPSAYLRSIYPGAGQAISDERTPIGGSSTEMPPVLLRAMQPVSDSPQATPPFNPNVSNNPAFTNSLRPLDDNQGLDRRTDLPQQSPQLMRTLPPLPTAVPSSADVSLPPPSGLPVATAPTGLARVNQDPQGLRQEREDMLRDPRMVQPSHHRFRDALKVAGLGALQGLATTGSIGGAIGGALGGGAVGVFDKKAYPRIKAARELGQMERQDAATFGRQKQGLDLRALQSEVDLREAEAKKAMRPEQRTFQGADGLQYSLSEDGKTATVISGQGSKATGRERIVATETIGDKLYYRTETGLEPALDPTTGQQFTDPSKKTVPYVMDNGQTVNITQAEAATADAQRGRFNTEQGNEYSRTLTRDAREEAIRRQEARVKDWTEAGAQAKDYNLLVNKQNQTVARIKGLEAIDEGSRTEKQQEEYAALLDQNKDLDAQIRTLDSYLGTTYSEHLTKQPDGSYRQRPRPQMPDLPKPQPPSKLTRQAGASRPRIKESNVGAAIDDYLKAGKFKTRAEAESYIRQSADIIP